MSSFLFYECSDDLLRAIKKLKALGNGFSVISVGNGKYMVQSVPGELSMDHTSVLEHVQVLPIVFSERH